MGWRIASFNLFKFSSNRCDENIRKNIYKICEIIRNEKIDILAIQEIFNESALKMLIQGLNPFTWEGRWESPNSKSVSAAEGYAFLWNKNRVSLASNREGKIFEPRILNQYKVDKSIGQQHLIRNPYYARFVVNANKCIEFRLINTHIMFSTNRSRNEDENHDVSVELSDIAMRRNEFNILVKAIFPKISDKAYDYYYGEGDSFSAKPYTFILGDYNLNLPGLGRYPTIQEPLYIYCENGDLDNPNNIKQIITCQSDLTTLKAKSLSNPNEPIRELKNNYDHFTYDKNRTMQVSCWAVDPIANGYYSGNYDNYKKEVSDHLMIVSEINLI